MNEEKNTPEWLSAQESFQRYCLNPQPGDRHYWSEWLQDNAVDEKTVTQARDIVLRLALQPSPAETEAELERFRQALPAREAVINPRGIGRSFWRIAATITLLLAAYWLWEEVATPVTGEVATTFGETRAVELKDGSMVMLNANSTIRFDEEWSDRDDREIWLEGEAFFEVTHRDGQAFIVHSDLGDIRVLGTSFNVADRPGQFAVTLVEGSVQFELSNRKIIKLSPNEQLGVYNDTLYHRKVDLESITAWRYDRMVFKNAPISSIIERLEQDFNWQVSVKNQDVLTRKVNATIPKNDPKLLLEALSVLYDLDITKINEQEYLIE